MQDKLIAQIIDYLLTLNLSTSERRTALLVHAQMDQEFLNKIDCSSRPIDFVAQCVNEAAAYGRLASGIDAIDQLLRGAGAYGGPEKRQMSEKLRTAWCAGRPASDDKSCKTPPEPPLGVARGCLESAYSAETLTTFCQVYFPSVYKRRQDWHGFDKTIRDILQYCDEHEEWVKFWNAIEVEHPETYARYYPSWRQ